MYPGTGHSQDCTDARVGGLMDLIARLRAACKDHHIILSEGVGLTKVGTHTIMFYGIKRDTVFTRCGIGRHVRYLAVTGGEHLVIEPYEN